MGYGSRHSILVPILRGTLPAVLMIGSHFVATATLPGSTSRWRRAALRARSDAPLP
jgi:hypothetical protein